MSKELPSGSRLIALGSTEPGLVPREASAGIVSVVLLSGSAGGTLPGPFSRVPCKLCFGQKHKRHPLRGAVTISRQEETL